MVIENSEKKTQNNELKDAKKQNVHCIYCSSVSPVSAAVFSYHTASSTYVDHLQLKCVL